MGSFQTDSLDSLTFDEFFSFYQNLCFRMDVADIFYNIRLAPAVAQQETMDGSISFCFLFCKEQKDNLEIVVQL